jgi:predicted nucleotidyltransferase
MKIGEARRQAGALVESLRGEVAVEGAYLIGSIAAMASDVDLPATSDLDVMVVVPDDVPPPKLGKVDVGVASATAWAMGV